MKLIYQDSATFVKVTADGYGNDKVIDETASVPVIFLQTTGFEHGNFQDGTTADAVCYPDPENTFVLDNNNRLEGMYILAPLFGVTSDEGWYKVVDVSVNRDHLLTNTINNIELTLKKTRRIMGVS